MTWTWVNFASAATGCVAPATGTPSSLFSGPADFGSAHRTLQPITARPLHNDYLQWIKHKIGDKIFVNILKTHSRTWHCGHFMPKLLATMSSKHSCVRCVSSKLPYLISSWCCLQSSPVWIACDDAHNQMNAILRLIDARYSECNAPDTINSWIDWRHPRKCTIHRSSPVCNELHRATCFPQCAGSASKMSRARYPIKSHESHGVVHYFRIAKCHHQTGTRRRLHRSGWSCFSNNRDKIGANNPAAAHRRPVRCYSGKWHIRMFRCSRRRRDSPLMPAIERTMAPWSPRSPIHSCWK